MNVDQILDTLNRHQVRYLLIGGMNFLLRHSGALTYDVDVWIDDEPDNLSRCEAALAELDAQWGEGDDDWGPVSARPPGWLGRQSVFCLTSQAGAIDIFRHVAGLDDWNASFEKSESEQTAAGMRYCGLADEDMLKCQLALSQHERKADRITALKSALKRHGDERRPEAN